MTNSTIAQHPGHCAECDQQIAPGQRIERVNAFSAWTHISCPRTRFDLDPADVCGECFTARAANGACSCL